MDSLWFLLSTASTSLSPTLLSVSNRFCDYKFYCVCVSSCQLILKMFNSIIHTYATIICSWYRCIKALTVGNMTSFNISKYCSAVNIRFVSLNS